MREVNLSHDLSHFAGLSGSVSEPMVIGDLISKGEHIGASSSKVSVHGNELQSEIWTRLSVVDLWFLVFTAKLLCPYSLHGLVAKNMPY